MALAESAADVAVTLLEPAAAAARLANIEPDSELLCLTATTAGSDIARGGGL